MEKDAYYFPHFCNARNDRKIRRVRKELGIEGYGIYFMILEVLREQKDFRYPMDDIDLLADEFRTSDQKVRVVVCNYDLFKVDENEQFFSPKFMQYLNPYLEKKRRNRVNGIKGNLIKYNYATKEQISSMTDDEILRLSEDKAYLLGGESGGDSHSDRNKSKVNKSKLNNTTNVTALADDVPNASNSETWESANRVAEYLLEAICETDPTHKYNKNRPSLKRWVKDIDKAMRLDGRTEEQLLFLINAVFRESHKYSELWHKWPQNIQSGDKLRDQFDKIKNEIKASNGQSVNNKIKETEQFLSSYQE